MIVHCHLSDRGTQLNYLAQNHLKKDAEAFDEQMSARRAISRDKMLFISGLYGVRLFS